MGRDTGGDRAIAIVEKQWKGVGVGQRRGEQERSNTLWRRDADLTAQEIFPEPLDARKE